MKELKGTVDSIYPRLLAEYFIAIGSHLKGLPIEGKMLCSSPCDGLRWEPPGRPDLQVYMQSVVGSIVVRVDTGEGWDEKMYSSGVCSSCWDDVLRQEGDPCYDDSIG